MNSYFLFSGLTPDCLGNFKRKGIMSTINIRSKLIEASDFAVVPDTGKDMADAVAAMLSSGLKPGTEIYLAPGEYVFRHHVAHEVTVAFHLKGISGIRINGNGARFVCHGYVMPFKIEDCEDIEIGNFTVDWARPYITQGRVRECGIEHVDLEIDREQYSYIIENGRFLGIGPAWGAPRPLSESYHDVYDAETREIPARLRDNPLGLRPDSLAAEIGAGLVRFTCQPSVPIPPGFFVTLNHGRYIVKGIDIWRSIDVRIKEVTLHHVLSGGVVAARTTNLEIDGLRIVPNESKGRVFSNVADGIHLCHCRGTINVSNVEMAGQGDDFLNIHGRNSVMTEKLGVRQALVVRADCWDVGDEVWVVRRADGQRREVLRVAAIARIAPIHDLAKSETQLGNGIGLGWGLSTDKQGEWRVEFESEFPADITAGDIFENKTWTPDLFTLRHCRILRRHRARGVLATVPGKVIIEDNYFATAGAAILIEGDVSYWYESGGVTEVVIRNNVFDNCLSSGSDTSDVGWQWGGAIFTITPSLRAADESSPPYHRNILIEGNRIETFDAPLVRACSVGGLRFVDNTVVRSQRFEPFAFQKEAFWFDGCRAVEIRGNRFENGFDGSTIRIGRMQSSDIDFSPKEEGSGVNPENKK